MQVEVNPTYAVAIVSPGTSLIKSVTKAHAHTIVTVNFLWTRDLITTACRDEFANNKPSLPKKKQISACFESEEHNPYGSETSAGSFCSTECFLTGGFVRFRLLDASFFLPRTVAAPGDISPTVQIEISVVDKFTYYLHDSGW